MDNKYKNLCSRCGKERVFVRSWKEKLGNSTVTSSEYSCPDKDCQKLVEKENTQKINRFKASQLRRKNSIKRSKKKK